MSDGRSPVLSSDGDFSDRDAEVGEEMEEEVVEAFWERLSEWMSVWSCMSASERARQLPKSRRAETSACGSEEEDNDTEEEDSDKEVEVDVAEEDR